MSGQPNLSELAEDIILSEISGQRDLNLGALAQEIYLGEVELRGRLLDFARELTRPIARLFIIANVLILLLVIGIWWVEWHATIEGRTFEPLITEGVIKTLIGATTVQLGAAMLTIVGGVFRNSGTRSGDIFPGIFSSKSN